MDQHPGGLCGESYNTYNTSTGKWQQNWVDNKGSVTEYFDRHFEKNTMILQTSDTKQANGGFQMQKMIFLI